MDSANSQMVNNFVTDRTTNENQTTTATPIKLVPQIQNKSNVTYHVFNNVQKEADEEEKGDDISNFEEFQANDLESKASSFEPKSGK